MSDVALVLLGGGKMGEALLGGLLAAKWAGADQVIVVEPLATRRVELAALFAGLKTVESIGNLPGDLRADGVIIAVKPQYIADVCRKIAPHAQRILSIAAGVPTRVIEAALREGDVDNAEHGAVSSTHRVIRSMPNTPSLVGMGASAMAAGAHATPEDLAWAAGILGAVGVVEQVDEKLLDAVTGVSGSGPAYIFLVAEALVEGGVAAGLPRAVAVTLAHQTIAGAGKLLVESGDAAATLRANVTSPGGTTAAGLRALEAHGLRSAFIEAVAAATNRSKELG
jgi:pyrroline-5-carboxylate reductase